MSASASAERGSEPAALVAGLSVALVGAAALAGWVLGVPVLASWRPDSVPMSPVAAVLALLLGTAFGLCSAGHAWSRLHRLAEGLAWLVVLAATALLALRLLNIQTVAGPFGVALPDAGGEGQVGYVAPVSVGCFLIAAIALLATERSQSHSVLKARGTTGAGGLLTIVGAAFLAAHLLGAPLLGGELSIPPAPNTSVVVLVLGGLLLFCGLRMGVTRQPARTAPGEAWVFVGIVVGVGAAILLGGYAYYRSEERSLVRKAEDDLRSVSQLKVEQLTHWWHERVGDATVMKWSVTDDELGALAAGPGPALRPRLLEWLRGYQAYGQYDRADVLDNQGTPLLSLPEGASPVSRTVVAAVPTALRSGSPTLVDVYLDEGDGRAHLTLLVPLTGAKGTGGRSVVVALRIDPDAYLYPVAHDWPTPTSSAEGFLVRRDGNQAVYVSRLRHDASAPLRRRERLSEWRGIAVQAALGKTGRVDGLDFRGNAVMGFIAPVPDSNWTLVSVVALTEVNAGLWNKVALVTSFVGLLLFSSGTGAWLLWHGQRLRQTEKDALMVRRLSEHEESLRLALSSGSQGLWNLDVATGTIIVSPEYAVMLGYNPGTFHESVTDWAARLHPDDRRGALATQQAFLEGGTEQLRSVFRLRTASGQWKWILSQGKLASRTEDGAPERVVGIHTDITSVKTAEARAFRFAALYAALSHCNAAIARSSGPGELFPQVCDAAVTHGGLALAWVGLVDGPAGRVKAVAAAGSGADYLDGIRITVNADDPYGQGPTGTAIRENRPVWIDDFPTNPVTRPWRERGARQGWTASAALPLRRAGRAVGALTIYSRVRNSFDEDDRRLLVEMAADIDLALDRFDALERHAQAETLLQESEARYRALFLDSSVPMLVIAPESGALVDVNPAAERYYGWSRDTLVTIPLSALNMATPEEVVDQTQTVEREGRNEHHLRHRLANGDIRDVEIFSSRVELLGQTRLLSVVIDVTARARAEASLQTSLREKEALLREVHHRVKNNLQVITSLLRLEAGRSVEGKVTAVLGEMQGRILSMALLHETLYRSGNLAQVDLASYLTQLAQQLLRSVGPRAGVTLALEVASVSVDMDTAIPCGLLVNELMSNALKHAFPDGRTGQVGVRLERVDDGPVLRLTIRDTGVGLPDDIVERSSRTLGLQLVESLVRQLQGTLTIDTAEGAAFVLTFEPNAAASPLMR